MPNWIDLTKLPHGLGANFVAPRAAVQGALFSSLVFRGRVVRPEYSQENQAVVCEWGATTVTQVGGQRLDQGDADVYFALVREAAKQTGSFFTLTVKADELLRDIGRDRGTQSREWLAGSLERLKNASFEFSITGLPVRQTTLLRAAAPLNEAKSAFMVIMADGMKSVFEAGKTLIKSAQRMELGTDTLAKWMHSFFSSHSKSGESKLSVDKLMVVTGRESMRKDRFKAGLAESIARLRIATGWSIKLEGDVLKVKQAAGDTAPAAQSKQPASPGASRPAGASAEPAAVATGWDAVADGIKHVEQIRKKLSKLDLSAIVGLMNAESRAAYDEAKAGIDSMDFPAKKAAALAAIEDQAHEEVGTRAYAAMRKSSADDDI